jgi:hypothetical protein
MDLMISLFGTLLGFLAALMIGGLADWVRRRVPSAAWSEFLSFRLFDTLNGANQIYQSGSLSLMLTLIVEEVTGPLRLANRETQP